MKNKYSKINQYIDKTNDNLFLIVCLVVSIFIGSFFGANIGFTLFLIMFFGGSLYLENKEFKKLLETELDDNIFKERLSEDKIKAKKDKGKNRIFLINIAIGTFLYVF